MLAQAWALAYAAHFVHIHTHLSVMIRYDSEYAAAMTQGLWSPQGNESLISIGAGLLSFVTQITKVEFAHVRSHNGDPWSEAADKMCDESGKGDLCSFNTFEGFGERTAQPKFAEWAFMYVASNKVKQAYLPFSRNTGRLDARPPGPSKSMELSSRTIAEDIGQRSGKNPTPKKMNRGSVGNHKMSGSLKAMVMADNLWGSSSSTSPSASSS